jgi:hypothetical protein
LYMQPSARYTELLHPGFRLVHRALFLSSRSLNLFRAFSCAVFFSDSFSLIIQTTSSTSARGMFFPAFEMNYALHHHQSNDVKGALDYYVIFVWSFFQLSSNPLLT